MPSLPLGLSVKVWPGNWDHKAFIKEIFPDTYALKEKDGILSPESIADAYWFVHSQHRSAWTHELDLRPYMEKF